MLNEVTHSLFDSDSFILTDGNQITIILSSGTTIFWMHSLLTAVNDG